MFVWGYTGSPRYPRQSLFRGERDSNFPVGPRMTGFNWPIDGSIVGLYLLVTMAAGLAMKRYVSRVDDFLVAGREMDVFLGIASLAATEFGIVTCMYAAQNGYLYGFAGATPGILMAIAMLVVGVTGFCIKPLRDSGVITIPQLIEKRFGPRIRWASGVVIVLGGLLNMGVFLRVGGDFLVHVSGIDAQTSGRQNHYLEIMMTVLLVGVAAYTILGGMLSVLVTDFLQFVVMSAGLIAVTILILYKVGWHTIVATVESNHGAGGFNPFLNAKLGLVLRRFQCVSEYGRRVDVANHDCPRTGFAQHGDRPKDLHAHQLLFRVPVLDPRLVGHRRVGDRSDDLPNRRRWKRCPATSARPFPPD